MLSGFSSKCTVCVGGGEFSRHLWDLVLNRHTRRADNFLEVQEPSLYFFHIWLLTELKLMALQLKYAVGKWWNIEVFWWKMKGATPGLKIGLVSLLELNIMIYNPWTCVQSPPAWSGPLQLFPHLSHPQHSAHVPSHSPLPGSRVNIPVFQRNNHIRAQS